MGMVTLCAVGTFPSVWGSFALGPQLRLHQLSKGWRRWAHFQGRSHSVVLCHTGARTFRRTIIPSCLFAGTDAVLSLGPSQKGERKICEASCEAFSTWRTLWCRCGFFRPHL